MNWIREGGWEHADVEDVWMTENRTLGRRGRAEILGQIEGAVDVMEVYSRPRLTKVASGHGLRLGAALDLLTGRDFNKASDRNEALEMVRTQQPSLLMLSPYCAPFSQLQYI